MATLNLNVRVDAADKKILKNFVIMLVYIYSNKYVYKSGLREQSLPFEVKANNYDKVIYEN